MERAVSALGSRFAISEVVVGGLILAAVTSLPKCRRCHLPGKPRPRRGDAEHRPQQQRAQCQHRPAGPGRRHRPWPALGPGHPDRSLVHRADSGSAGARLPRPRLRPGRRHPCYRRLPCLRRITTGVGVRAVASCWIAAAPVAPLATCCSRLAIARQVAGRRPATRQPAIAPGGAYQAGRRQDRAAEPLRGLSQLRRVGRRIPSARLAGRTPAGPRPYDVPHRRRRCCPGCPWGVDRAAHHRALLRPADRSVGASRADRVVG
jgi:hypothetical protein